MSQESKEDLVVYGKPDCVQCTYTTKELDKLHLPYRYVDVTASEEERNRFLSLDMGTALPAVVAGPENRWSGFKLDRIRGLKNAE